MINEKTQEAIDEVLEDKVEITEWEKSQAYRHRIQHKLNTVLYLVIILQAVYFYKLGVLFNSFAGGVTMTGLLYLPILWMSQHANNKTWIMLREYIEKSDDYENVLVNKLIGLKQEVIIKDEKIKAQEGHIELLAASVEKLTPKVELKVKKTKK